MVRRTPDFLLVFVVGLTAAVAFVLLVLTAWLAVSVAF